MAQKLDYEQMADDSVKAGQPIIRLDRKWIEAQGCDTTTMLIIANPNGKEIHFLRSVCFSMQNQRFNKAFRFLLVPGKYKGKRQLIDPASSAAFGEHEERDGNCVQWLYMWHFRILIF